MMFLVSTGKFLEIGFPKCYNKSFLKLEKFLLSNAILEKL